MGTREVIHLSHLFGVLICLSQAMYSPDQIRALREIDDLEKKGCGNNPADIVFVLDESGSIWGPDFDKQIDFVGKVLKEFDIGPDRTHVGLMTFASTVKVHFNLKEYTSYKAIASALANVGQRRGGTKTYDAIQEMTEDMFSDKYIRSNVPQIAILITDGESDDPEETKNMAKLAKDKKITMFAIGVGRRINEDELESIASSPVEDYKHSVENYAALMKLRKILAWQACKITTLPPPTTTTTTTTTTTIPTTTLPQMMENCEDRHEMDVIAALPDQANREDTDKAIGFISSVVSEMNLGPNQVLMGMTPRYCDSNNPPIKLGSQDTERGFRNELETRRLTGTRTDKHIEYMHNVGILSENGGRDRAAKFGILLIDNESEDFEATKAMAEAAKQDMYLIVIGVGQNVKNNELRAIASSKDSLFTVDSYDELGSLYEEVLQSLCDGLSDFVSDYGYGYNGYNYYYGGY